MVVNLGPRGAGKVLQRAANHKNLNDAKKTLIIDGDVGAGFLKKITEYLNAPDKLQLNL